MTKDFLELHGDRTFKDDQAIVGGFARLDDMPVMVIGHQKGRDTKSNVFRNFGMPNPEGYRKALRLMKLAEKFQRPVITLLDTPGAFPGLEAEERGQAEAIARNLFEMSRLSVPIVVTIIGEGASGGALGHRHRRQDPDAGEYLVFRDLAGIMLEHPLAKLGLQGTGRRGAAADRARPEEAGDHRRDRPRTAGWGAPEPRTGGEYPEGSHSLQN